jgi:hypothetical protein
MTAIRVFPPIGDAKEMGYIDGDGVTVARFNEPHGIAVDGKDNILVCDLYNDCIRMVSSSGIVVASKGHLLYFLVFV